MSQPPEEATARVASDCLRFARAKLGPASERFLSEPAMQVLVLSRVRNGNDLEDAVLAEIHRAAAGNRSVADEFLSFFLTDLMRVGHRLRSAALQRYLDTGDLVQSVVGDLWQDLFSLRFETRGRFLSYLSRRLQWKASDHSRALQAGSRREDRRLDADPSELAERAAPMLDAVAEEDRERLALLLPRLLERDRQLLVRFLKGKVLAEIASELGLSLGAARMALARAVRRARRLT